jgi:hypothetical protein
MIKLEIKEFVDGYSHLNTSSINHKVSLLDIARAYMTIGYPRLITAISNYGIFRFCEIYLRVINNLESAGSFYRLKSHFKSLDPSEQKTISYFFGQSLTKLFAEDFLDCRIVFNTNDFKSSITTQASDTVFKPKRELTRKWKKTPKEPDLIGITNQNNYHVLEAKGSSSKYSLTDHQHAINQVSVISKINGKDPETKSACYFKLYENQIGGLIIDPDSDLKSINISFEDDSIVRKYYSIFNLNYLKRNKFWKINAGSFDFAIFRIPFPYYPYIYFGVDMEIFNSINKGGVIEFRDYPKELEFNNKSVKEYSIGRDGTLLISLTRPTNLETGWYET